MVRPMDMRSGARRAAAQKRAKAYFFSGKLKKWITIAYTPASII
jgi:hypothetical protein